MAHQVRRRGPRKTGQGFRHLSQGLSLAFLECRRQGEGPLPGCDLPKFRQTLLFCPGQCGCGMEGKIRAGQLAPRRGFDLLGSRDGEIFENGQTQKFITLTKDQSSVERLWKNIRNAVLKHNFVLGTRMPMPKTKEK